MNNKEMSISIDSDIEPNGFLELDHCDVCLARGESDTNFSDDPDPWFDVEIPPAQEIADHQTGNCISENTRRSNFPPKNLKIICCPRCSLVLAKNSYSGKTKQLSVYDGVSGTNGSNFPRYDGTIHGTKCPCCSGKQRSDAALLMGLALLSQDLGHIDIRSIKVGLYKTVTTNGNAPFATNLDHTGASHAHSTAPKPRSISGSNNRKMNKIHRKEKACLLIAFRCREIAGLDLPNQQRRFFEGATKQLLHPATQLIMSIMSSDWNMYDAKIAKLSSQPSADKYGRKGNRSQNGDIDFRNRNRNGLNYFPTKLNLEDVFKRISGVSPSLLLSDPQFDLQRRKNEAWIKGVRFDTHHESNKCTENENQHNNPNSNISNGAKTIKLTALPRDILRHGIGQYLRAKSLDSLRGTCKYLHWTLRAVVPGLKLRLYSHQVKSLMWMRGRESKLITENELLRGQRRSISRAKIKNTLDGDAHRAATGGATVVLCPRERQGVHRFGNSSDNGSHLDKYDAPVRISQFDHSELIERHKYGNVSTLIGSYDGDHDPMARKVARGGLLCDDPGLGKTITVMSLILQTLGLSTEKNDSCCSKSTTMSSSEHEKTTNGNGKESIDIYSIDRADYTLAPNDERIFAEYWKEQIIPEFRCKALTKLFSTFLRSSPDVNFFYDNYWTRELQSKTNIAFGKPPISLKDILRCIDRSKYGDSLEGFVSDVEEIFQNVLSHSLVSNSILQAAQRLVIVFRSQIKSFKQRQIQVAIKSFSRTSVKPNSVVAALIEKSSIEKLQKALVPSSGTLLVVPAVLVDHWREQLRLNINLSYCTNKIPLIFEYNGNNKSNERVREITQKCLVEKTHFPLVFVDRTATKKLPSASFLAIFKIVLTTNSRFSCEWKNGSFEDEMRRNFKDNSSGGNGGMTDFREGLATSEEACPLLKVNWLRMIVDEGHSMGRGRDSSSISFASWINSQRRWGMTGTPTPQTSTQSGLMNVLNLLQYLQHEFFTRRHGGDTIWNKLIVKSWNSGYVSSFFRLRSLLSMLMIRHIKSDIAELPLPTFQTNSLSMDPEEISTYNTLVCAVQSNLIITSMKGKTSGAQDSLLHKSQTRHAREAIGNLRLVCAGGTQVRPTLSAKYRIEFHQDFDSCNTNPAQQQKIRNFIFRATSGQQSKCDCCSIMLSTLLVFPCGHLVCTECVDCNTASCVVCDKKFDIDAFQRLQPGFKYDWLHNVEEEMKRQLTKNDDTIQGNNEPLLLPGGQGLFVPPSQRRRRARTRKYGDGHICQYDPQDPSGHCILCFTEHEPCYLAGERRCKICYRLAQDCPSSESKITHIISKLLVLYTNHQDTKKSIKECDQGHESTAILPERSRTPKVIIFSQFRKVLNITGDRLLRRFGSGCIAEYWGKYRKKELNKFIHDEKCLCMLLGKDGAEGLDLSFVTHIIFLEQVWDKSLENQVVARAWRMGAKGSVNVETLVAENSIEETMLLLEGNSVQDQSDIEGGATGISSFYLETKDKKRSEYQQAKLHYLLKNLKLIVNSNTIDFSSSNKRKSVEIVKTSLDMQKSATKNPAEKKEPKRQRVRFKD